MTNKHIALALSGALILVACDFDVPDLNRPAVDTINTNPTPALMASLATGLVAGHRLDIASRIGYVSELGILGRESLVLSGSDDRFVTELLNGVTLDPSTPNFGGNFWVAEYANLRNANLLLDALKPVVGLTDQEKESIRGFAKTMKALDLLKIINTHDVNGAAIDVDRAPGDLAPIVGKDAVFDYVQQLLEEARAHLAGASAAFPFPLGNGFTSFNTPATFLLVNRALAARVDVYRGQYTAALAALAVSFIDPATPNGTPASATSLAPWPGTGVFHAFGNGSGDLQNNLNTTDILAHQSIVSDAESLKTPPTSCTGLTGDALFTGGCLDNRVLTKLVFLTDSTGAPAPVSLYGETSGYGITLYPNTNSPVPIIRNEELILLRAEANCAPSPYPPTAAAPGTCTGNAAAVAAAISDINFIRTTSGGLAARTDLNASNIVDELLKQRRYSLLFEGGHRWIDARRYGRANGPVATLPIDQPAVPQRVQTAFPIPQAEVNARGGH